ncbi:hypothetical protein D3C74_311790 [compost metagenome]
MASLLIQHLTLLFGYRASQQVRFTEREARHLRGNLHDLLLIYDNTIRILQKRLQILMRIFHCNLPMLPGNKFWNKFHRTRTIQRQYRNDILEHRWLQIAQHTPHPCRFKLKHTRRFSSAKHLIGQWVIVRSRAEIQCASGSFFNRLKASLNDR